MTFKKTEEQMETLLSWLANEALTPGTKFYRDLFGKLQSQKRGCHSGTKLEKISKAKAKC